MDQKEEGILLGELKAFKEAALTRLNDIEKKVDSLDRFKLKVTVTMVIILGTIEFLFKVYEVYAK